MKKKRMILKRHAFLLDSTKPRSKIAGEEVANGHVKEKHQTSSHTGDGNKHHEKKKWGNHGNRKKK